ncbi:MAG: Crp/Fnr family transcriptional regulator [Caldilineales bacterium]|nr:Crp/Fnr family transcriptional regulator [Caldilineales bacterium]MCW5860661.1 Crp/Fnr family transcriptional regulator [Caldilineales bacterium]
MKDLTNTISNEQISDLFAQLPAEDPAFGRALTNLRVAPGDCIATPEELRQHLYILVAGMVQLVVSSKEGRSMVTARLLPGAVFGEDAIVDLGPTAEVCVQAIEPCTVWRFSREQASGFIERHPVIGLGLLRTFGRRLAQVENRLEDVAYRRLPERLAGEIVRQSRLAGDDQIRISHQALADTLGTYRETISAILRDFKRENWVELGYRRITILNPTALGQMAGAVYD